MNTSSYFLDTLKKWIEVVAKQSMHGFIVYAKEHGLSMSQLGALMHISKKGVSGITDIGDDLGVTNAAVSQMIDRMVQHNLIERTEDPDDRRAKRIELTQKGKKVIGECTEARQRWLVTLSDSISDADKKLAAKMLELLIDKTRELENTLS